MEDLCDSWVFRYDGIKSMGGSLSEVAENDGNQSVPEGESRRRRPPRGGGFDYFAAADGTRLRYGQWKPERETCRGTILLMVGRREFIDKHFETIADLLDRGFSVCALDWRGQGLSQRSLANRQKGHVRSFEEYLADLRMFRAEIVAPRTGRPLSILAHSMGAHLALRYLGGDHGDCERAVLIAPMIDIYRSGLPKWVISAPVALALRAGGETAYALGQHDHDKRTRAFEGNPLTSDPERFADEGALIDKDGKLALGGVTNGWLHAAFESIRILQAPGYGARVDVPVLIVGAGRDTVVSNRALKKFAGTLPDCRFITLAGARHEILKERDDFRLAFWRAFDEFMTSGTD